VEEFVFLVHDTSVTGAGQATAAPRQRFGKGSAGSYDAAVARLLLAEDDDAIREPLARALEREGYAVDAVGDGTRAEALGLAGGYELLVLDIGLPGLDGLEVCRRVRRARPALPILLLTAQDGELDAVAGLDAGADDYVTKPFRLAELLARVRAQVRRSAPDVLRAGDVSVDPAARRAWAGDAEVELTPKEFELLELLLRNAGLVVARERIMEEVWDENWFGSTKTLDMHVSALRRKLGDDAAAPTRITTVRGVGLRFET
jgi:DNA-binding response OmpR family regulator